MATVDSDSASITPAFYQGAFHSECLVALPTRPVLPYSNHSPLIRMQLITQGMLKMTTEYFSELDTEMSKATGVYLSEATVIEDIEAPEVQRKGLRSTLTVGKILARTSRVPPELLFHCDASFGAALLSEQLRGFGSRTLCNASDEDLQELQVANMREAKLLHRDQGCDEKNSDDEDEDTEASDDGSAGDDEEDGEREEIGRVLSVPVHCRLEAMYTETACKGIELLLSALGCTDANQV